MGTITSKINLASLKHVVMEQKGKDGMVKGIFIPIEANNLFFSEKTDAVYLDMISFDLKEPKDDQTHLTKQSFSKKVREAMTEEEQKAVPIIGNINVNFGGGGSQPAANAAPGVVLSEGDELPF